MSSPTVVDRILAAGPPAAFANLEEDDTPPRQGFGQLMRECAPDPVTRSVATAAVVLALAQVGGSRAMAPPPGFLLLNTGQAAADPIDRVAAGLTGYDLPWPPGPPDERRWQRRQLRYLAKMLELGITGKDPAVRADLANWHGDFVRYRTEVCGGDRGGPYARRHDRELGWITDLSGHVVARLEDKRDRLRFRHAAFTQLRQRLSGFPADYEYFILRVTRELVAWCERLAAHVNPLAGYYSAIGQRAGFGPPRQATEPATAGAGAAAKA